MKLFFRNALFPLRRDNFLQGVGFTRRSTRPFIPPKLRTTESDVLGRGGEAGLSGDVEQKCGKMFVSSSHFFVE